MSQLPASRTSGPSRRRYEQRSRAEQTLATRQRILDRAYQLLLALPYDEVTLDAVAEGAGVTVQTVLRHVGSKEGLLTAGANEWMTAETNRRNAEPGDIASIARVLASRYEELGVATMRLVALGDRLPLVAGLIEDVRQGHRQWLEEMFEPWLRVRSPHERARRVAQLFAATEIYSWTSWRRSLGLSAPQAEQALRELLETLAESWGQSTKGGRR